MEQERIGDALGIPLNIKRVSGLNFIIGDKEEVFDLEIAAIDYNLIYPSSGYIAHSNHYMSDRLKEYERGPLCFQIRL